MLDRDNIRKLRDKLEELLKNYHGEEKIKITYDLDAIHEIIFNGVVDWEYFNKHKMLLESLDMLDKIVYYNFAFNIELMKKLDFTGISFDTFRANNIDFTGFDGVSLNPETLYKQEIICSKLNGVKIIGSLEECTCYHADFTGSTGGIMSKTKYLKLKDNNNLTDVQIVDYYGEFSDAIDRAFQKVKK